MLPRHAIALQFLQTGILLCGPSGIGKTDLMLTLVDRGAQLVCDDAPLYQWQAHGQNSARLIARCPPGYYGQTHIRGIGIVTLPDLLGKHCCTPQCVVELVIQLLPAPAQYDSRPQIHPCFTRLSCKTMPVEKTISVYQTTLIMDKRRNMAFLLELLVRYYQKHIACAKASLQRKQKNKTRIINRS